MSSVLVWRDRVACVAGSAVSTTCIGGVTPSRGITCKSLSERRLMDTSTDLFFFSSRRRHTRSDRDWSSDVCSSDLIPAGVLDQPAHRDLARQAAREAIVLLKNARGLLPLRKDLRTLAVIGPNADQWRVLLGNYNGLPADPVTPLRGIREAVGKGTRVLYARGADLAEGFPVLDVAPSSALSTSAGRPGLDVAYFNNRAMAGAPVSTAVDTALDVSWNDGAPRADLNPDDFAVRWTGALRPPHSGTYRLGLIGTLRFQLFLDDSLVLRSVYPTHDGEFPDPRPVRSEPLRLEAGRSYRLRVDAQESYGDAQLHLLWSTPQETLEAEALRAAGEADVVVLCLGPTAQLEGEEMP